MLSFISLSKLSILLAHSKPNFSLVCRITVKIDDEMLKHYVNEDLFILEVKRDTHSDEEELYEVTLIEQLSP